MSPAPTEEEIRERERTVRNGIIRSALLWTPLFVASAGALLFFFVDLILGGDRGTWFLVFVLAVFAFLFGSQSIQALLDVFGKPRLIEGDVTRRWARSDSVVMRTHYVRVGRTILRGEKHMLAEILVGDRVEVRYFPHSAVVVTIQRLARPGTEAPQDGTTESETAEAGTVTPEAPPAPEPPRRSPKKPRRSGDGPVARPEF